MALFDFLRSRPDAPVEYVHAVPVLARKVAAPGARARETYIFYAFLFEKSTERAVARLRKELPAEGFEFIEIAGQAETVPLDGWSDFVTKRLDWIRESLPTAAQLAEAPRIQIHFSPKIMQR